jgi:ubiquinone/menaquinone biosynthesis C-methylase UbiE
MKMQTEYRFTAEETWDSIAESFDRTRQKPWNLCLDFIDSLEKTDTVADLGCGNGRHLIPCAERCSMAVGVDISSRFLRIIQKKLQNKPHKNVTLLHADVVHLPFSDSSLDAILFIAALHNIPGKDHRQAALREVNRILKPKATALISVWSRWQDRYFKHFIKQFIIRTRSFGDIDVYWRQQNLNIPRFYHLYGKAEFHRELHIAGFKVDTLVNVKIHSKRFPDNYFALVHKR